MPYAWLADVSIAGVVCRPPTHQLQWNDLQKAPVVMVGGTSMSSEGLGHVVCRVPCVIHELLNAWTYSQVKHIPNCWYF